MSKLKKAKDSAYRTIRNAILVCKAKGIPIEQETWGARFDPEKGYFVNGEAYLDERGELVVEENSPVCALGALLVHKNGSFKFDSMRGRKPLTDIEVDDAAAIVLGVDKEWVDVFINAFDGNMPLPETEYTNYDVMSLKQRRDYDRRGYWHDGGRYIFTPTRSAKVKELRRAHRMGEKLRKEFLG